MKCFLILSLMCAGLFSKDISPLYISKAKSFTGDALDSFNRIDSLNRAAAPVWKKVYEEGAAYESLTPKEKELLDQVDGPDGPDEWAKSIYDISPQLFMSNCDDVAYSKNYRASSTLPSTSKYSYDISNIRDADLSTAWVEGEKGYGIGTRIYFTPDVTSWVRDSYMEGKSTVGFDIHLYNGYVKSPQAWRNNSRVKTALLGSVQGDTLGTLHIADTMGLQFFSVDLPVELLNRECYFEIVDVYKGEKWDDVAVTEFHFHDPGCCVAAGTAVTMADHSGKAVETLAVGDSVLTLDENGKQVPAAVLEMAALPHKNCWDISFGKTILTITDDHPVRLHDGSWGTVRGGVSPYLNGEMTKKLAAGDQISHQNGTVKISGITAVKRALETFTITKLSRGKQFFANGVEVAVEPLRPADK